MPPAPRHPLFIDALNVAYWCGAPPSLRLPLSLLAGALAQGYPAVLCFDANAPYLFADEAQIYGLLRQHAQHCVEAPAGKDADRLMLRQARDSQGCVISRDKYRDHRRKYRRLIDDPARLLPGEVRNDRLRVPALELDVPLASSAESAWQLLHGGKG